MAGRLLKKTYVDIYNIKDDAMYYCLVYHCRCVDENAHTDFKKHVGASIVTYNPDEGTIVIIVSPEAVSVLLTTKSRELH